MTHYLGPYNIELWMPPYAHNQPNFGQILETPPLKIEERDDGIFLKIPLSGSFKQVQNKIMFYTSSGDFSIPTMYIKKIFNTGDKSIVLWKNPVFLM